MVCYASRVGGLPQLQVQLFPLQLIARDVVFQGSALPPACLHIGDDLFGQLYVLLQHEHQVVQLVYVQIMPYKEKAYLLCVFP